MFPITSGADWLGRDLPAPDNMLGELLSTTSRLMLIGPTGLGKTMFLLAMAFAVAAGAPFLHWRPGEGPRRVLFIDGEMSNRLLKRRIEDAARRHGSVPETFHALCRDDVPDMLPLDTPKGQKYVDALMAHLGGVDLAIFDNIQALTISEDDFGFGSWQRVLPWAKDLTRRVNGQIWAHHTGNDESHGWGTKTREWQLDTVMLMERVEQPDVDLAFRIKFDKARARTPENRQDFEPAVIKLAADTWESERGGHVRTKRSGKDRALELLVDAIAREGVIPPACSHIPPDTPAVTKSCWRRYCQAGGIAASDDDAAFRKAWERHHKVLIGSAVAEWQGWVWIIR